jgi:hypothetical protein
LTEEQKGMLQEPTHPRVDQILKQVEADKISAERALKTRNPVRVRVGEPPSAKMPDSL